MTATYITIDETSYTLDSGTERAEATEAMADAGLDECPIFSGDPECADSVRTGKVLSREHGIVFAAK